MKTSAICPTGPGTKAPARGARSRHKQPRTSAQDRDQLYADLRKHPPGEVGGDEVEAHFRGMPKRYWESATKGELVWALETIHGFFKALATSDLPGSPVVVDRRHCPEEGCTKVMVCTWDRPGLLAKVAAAFTALRINIHKADVFTRTDNLVLDVFRVADPIPAPAADVAVLDRLKFLVEGALREPPRLVSVWASEFHKSLERPRELRAQVCFDLTSSKDYTVLQLTATDRLGLLCDLLQCLMGCEVAIAQAVVNTDRDLARGVFYVTDLEENKITHPARLEAIRAALLQAI